MNKLMNRKRADADRQALWVSLAAVLHDIRNPLHNATLLLESLDRQGSNALEVRDQVLEQLDRIHGRIRRVMEQLPEFAGEGMPPAPVRLAQVLNETLALIQPQAQEVDVAVGMNCLDELVVNTNAGFLTQALEHLMLNCLEILARQPQDKPRRLWLSATREKGVVWLSVQDSGPGLPPEVARAPFEPLVAQSPNGMGLGLAIAHALTRAGGGELMLQNTSDSGTHFRIRLEGTL